MIIVMVKVGVRVRVMIATYTSFLHPDGFKE